MATGREWKVPPYAPAGTPQGSVFQVDANGQLVPVDLGGIADGWTLMWDAGSGLFVVGAGGSPANADHAFYAYKAAALEPLAIEYIRVGTFAEVINNSTTKILLGSFQTRLGSSGRFEQRDPRELLLLRDVTVTGTGSDSTAAFIDPTAPTYSNARTTYFDRLNILATSSPKYLAVTAPTTFYPLLPGPYGNILIQVTNFDFTWLIADAQNSAINLNLANEINDTSAQRHSTVINLPVSRNIMAGIRTGAERSAGVGKGGVLYFICPATWGRVTDSTTYLFRDDFMGATLDTATKWTRSQSTAGNVEINTDFAWCKIIGNSNWGQNGARSQITTARSAGKVFECYVFTGSAANNVEPMIVGWNDAGGNSYTNFAHGLNFYVSTGNLKLNVYENGNARGDVGSGFSANTIYRVRITLGASNASYEIQGGSQYAAIGGSSWTTITPGTTSSSTTPLCAGFTRFDGDGGCYIGDVKIY